MPEMNQYENFGRQFDEKIGEASRVVITSHIDPDGDAISSIMAIGRYMKERFGDMPMRMMVNEPGTVLGEIFRDIFPMYEEIEVVSDLSAEIAEGDTLVFVDGNALDRFSSHPEEVSKFPSMVIDHHPGREIVGNVSVVDTTKSSTAEVILEALLPDHSEISPEMAKILLLGILSDTGFLSYVDDEHHRNLAAELAGIGGVDLDEFIVELRRLPGIAAGMYDEYKQNEQTIHFNNVGWPVAFASHIPDSYTPDQAPYAHVAKDEFFLDQFQRAKAEQATTGETTLPTWGYIVRPKGNGVFSVSFRSKADVNVRKLVNKLKEQGVLASGGGHPVSSAGVFNNDGMNYTAEEVIEKLTAAIEGLEPQLGK